MLAGTASQPFTLCGQILPGFQFNTREFVHMPVLRLHHGVVYGVSLVRVFGWLRVRDQVVAITGHPLN